MAVKSDFANSHKHTRLSDALERVGCVVPATGSRLMLSSCFLCGRGRRAPFELGRAHSTPGQSWLGRAQLDPLTERPSAAGAARVRPLAGRYRTGRVGGVSALVGGAVHHGAQMKL